MPSTPQTTFNKFQHLNAFNPSNNIQQPSTSSYLQLHHMQTPPFGNLTIGKTAPAFKGIDQNGEPISLKDYTGKNVIIYFYPKDDTPTCTTQACNLRDNYTNLLQDGFEIIGISPDPATKHKKFENKYELPFALVADEDHSIAEKYGVWGTKKFMGKVYDGIHRTTFLIDEKGKIKNIILKPNAKNHADEILIAWNEIM